MSELVRHDWTCGVCGSDCTVLADLLRPCRCQSDPLRFAVDLAVEETAAVAALCWFLRWVLDEDERRALRWFHEQVVDLHGCYDGEDFDHEVTELFREPEYWPLGRTR